MKTETFSITLFFTTEEGKDRAEMIRRLLDVLEDISVPEESISVSVTKLREEKEFDGGRSVGDA